MGSEYCNLSNELMATERIEVEGFPLLEDVKDDSFSGTTA